MTVDSVADALLLSAADVCARLGIGLSHFHSLRRQGRMPLEIVRLGRAVRFRASELSAWCDSGCPVADRWRAVKEMKLRG